MTSIFINSVEQFTAAVAGVPQAVFTKVEMIPIFKPLVMPVFSENRVLRELELIEHKPVLKLEHKKQ